MPYSVTIWRRDRRGAVDVVLGAGGGVGEDELLRGAPAEQHRELVDQLAAASPGTCPRSGSVSVYPSARPRGMIEILCTGSVLGSACATSA